MLEEAGEIEATVAERMRGWAGFRNVLVHDYIGIDHRQAAPDTFLDVTLTSAGAYSSNCGNSSVIVSRGDFEPAKMCFGCRSHIDSSRGAITRKRHDVIGDGHILTIGLGEQRPRVVESRTLQQ